MAQVFHTKPYHKNTENSIMLKPETAFNLLSTYFKNIEHRLNNECFIAKKDRAI